jgi:hypothetical protein
MPSNTDALSDTETLYEDSKSLTSKRSPATQAVDLWKKPRWDIEEVIRRGVIDARA